MASISFVIALFLRLGDSIEFYPTDQLLFLPLLRLWFFAQ
jgi:hypothetical protein